MTGQHGQIKGNNWTAYGNNQANNAGPNVYVGKSINAKIPATNAVAPASNLIEWAATSQVNMYSGQAVRLVQWGAALNAPTGLAVGTTYYSAMVPYDGTNNPKIGFTTNWTNLANTGTLIALSGTSDGTTFRIVNCWATAIDTTTNVITFNDLLPMATGDAIIVVGKNGPAGLTLEDSVTTGTIYYIRRTAMHKATLHASQAGAFANTGIVDITTTGTLTDFGFYAYGIDSAQNFVGSYYSDLGTLSSANAECGIINTGWVVAFKPYFEHAARGIDGRNASITYVN